MKLSYIASTSVFFLFSSLTAFAQPVNHNDVKIKRLVVSGHGSEKYLLIYPANPIASCEEGYWLNASHPGFKDVYTMALAAKITKMNFGIKALNEFRWPASAGRFCLIEEAQSN